MLKLRELLDRADDEGNHDLAKCLDMTLTAAEKSQLEELAAWMEIFHTENRDESE